MISPRELSGGILHLLHRINRIIFRRPATKYFDDLKKEADATSLYKSFALCLDHTGQLVTCHGCGYAVARISFDNGWSMDACTATGFTNLIGNEKVNEWLDLMADLP